VIYLYTLGDVLILTSAADLVTVGPDGTEVLKGKPFGPLGAKKPKPRVVAGRKPVAACDKCGRVFFQPQGVERHVKFCKGTPKGYVPK